MRLAALAGLVTLAAASHPSGACPLGRPCLKNRRRTETVVDAPSYYGRDVRAAIPKFDRKKLARFLAGARWTPVYPKASADGLGSVGETSKTVVKSMPSGRVTVNHVQDPAKLRFVDPAGTIPNAKADEHVVLIREIERDTSGNIFVSVDGTAYQLWYCVDKKRTVCLTQAGDFATMFPIEPEATGSAGSGFAPPPPPPAP